MTPRGDRNCHQMTRTDRVMDLLDLLRASEAMSVAAIAGALGVSRRTVLRDLATLRERGWPIRSDAGPGGGVFLERARGVTAVHLSVEEVVALWVGARLAASAAEMPWSVAARSALDKVLASIPKDRARRLHQLLRRVVIGNPATPEVRASLRPIQPGVLDAFEQSFSEMRLLAFDYRDRDGRRSARVVEPQGLLVEAPAWYLLARDRGNGEARSFRFDRIGRATVWPERFDANLRALHVQQLAQEAAVARRRRTEAAPEDGWT